MPRATALKGRVGAQETTELTAQYNIPIVLNKSPQAGGK